VKIEYKTKGTKCLTPCPFGQETPFSPIGGEKIVSVGSLVCDNCKYHKSKEKNRKGGVVECSAGEER